MTAVNKRAWIAVAVVVVLVGAAFAVNKATSKRSAIESASASLIAKADLPPCPATGHASNASGGLPSYTLPCLGAGPKVDLAKLRGPMVVNIWAGPCAPCKIEAPLIQQFYAKAAGKVGVLGVVDGAFPDTPDDALDAAHGLGLHYPSLFDAAGKLVVWTHSGGIPVTLFIDAKGHVVHRQVSQLQTGQLEQLVKQYLGVDAG